MATVPSQASSRSGLPGNETPFFPVSGEFPTVEESSEEFDLIGILRRTVSASAQPVDAILASVADAARVMSGADGTALALETRGAIICRARSGTIAPGLGAPISTESGISGECLRAGTTLVCHDTLSDPRVDSEVCQALGIRSIAAIPLLEGARGVGIVEAFSARPNAFDGDALSSLRALAEIAQIAYRREHPNPPASPPPTDPLATIRQAVKYTPRTFTAEEISSPTGQKHRNRIWVGAALVLVLMTVGVAWWSWHSPDDVTGATQTAHAAAAVETVNAKPPVPREILPKPTPAVSERHAAPPPPDIVLQNAAEIQPVEGQAADAAIATPGTMPRTTQAAAPEAAVEAPTVTLAASDNPEQLARLTSVEAQLPAGGPVVSGGVAEPVLLHKVEPIYPLQARTQRLSGKVVLTATIGTDGIVRGTTLVSGSPLLAEAARTAVRQWRYRPATLSGTPVEVQKDITFVFTQP